MDGLLGDFCARGVGVGAAGHGPLPIMVGESGPKSGAWPTSVGESDGSLPVPPGMSTRVGESEGSLWLGAGISIRVGESEDGAGRVTEPEDELSPFEGVRIAAPPSPGSEGLPSGRPRENSSINNLGP